jgi:hypothetical protein
MTHDRYFLSHGQHDSPADGRCAMEWVAYLAGEEHSDSPACVSPVLRSFGISLNDRWDDAQRQKLRPYLARCIGTAGDGRDPERSWLATDWLLREFLPAFLDLVPSLRVHAARIRACPPVIAMAELDHCMNLVNVAGTEAAASRAAAWAAPRNASRAAAGAAAWAASQAASRAAAGIAAGIAPRNASWAAAWDAAWAAARGASRAALGPVVARLQASALDLFDRMLPTEPVAIPATGLDEAAAVCGINH